MSKAWDFPRVWLSLPKFLSPRVNSEPFLGYEEGRLFLALLLFSIPSEFMLVRNWEKVSKLLAC